MKRTPEQQEIMEHYSQAKKSGKGPKYAKSKTFKPKPKVSKYGKARKAC